MERSGVHLLIFSSFFQLFSRLGHEKLTRACPSSRDDHDNLDPAVDNHADLSGGGQVDLGVRDNIAREGLPVGGHAELGHEVRARGVGAQFGHEVRRVGDAGVRAQFGHEVRALGFGDQLEHESRSFGAETQIDLGALDPVGKKVRAHGVRVLVGDLEHVGIRDPNRHLGILDQLYLNASSSVD
jgi:hypothetical protein